MDEKLPGFINWHSAYTQRRIPIISPELTFNDTMGSWKARWGIGRMSYLVPPGLYAIGAPDNTSPVVVTANYKMTYDLVRNALRGRNLWLLVLETYGINVWCAAGKGTFGTGELVRRIEKCGLGGIVAHRELLLPIMGAAGVKGVEIKARTGFNCKFAVLRIEDLPEYLDAGKQANAKMRELTFNLQERLVLTPVEIVSSLKSGLYLLPIIFIAVATAGGFNAANGLKALLVCLAAIISGAFISPLLLPWLPTRSFAAKGAFTGLFVAIALIGQLQLSGAAPVTALLCGVTAVSSFVMLNFTGSTPYTSRSGVKYEMSRALPLQGMTLLVALAAALFWRFQ